MNKDIRPPQHVLHVFDPNKKCKPHDEVEFIEGRYVDIVNTKNKDPHTLYFGKSKNSELLTGIFLGDLELTSKVKDISLASVDGVVTLSLKYVNDSGKLATVKTNIVSQKELDEVKEKLEQFDSSITEKMNASFNDVYERLNVIDTSITDINEHLTFIDTSVDTLFDRVNTIDTSYVQLIDDLDKGKYNYTIHKDSNKIEAKIWPEPIDKIDLVEGVLTLKDGTVIKDVTHSLDSSLIKTVTLDLKDYDSHINEFMNTDSSINDRLTIVEDQLKWEEIYK